MGNGTEISRQKGPPYRLHLLHHLAPGDVLVMTSALESLHKQYPGQYATSVYTTCMDVWRNNPWVVPQAADSQVIEMQYPAIHRSGEMATGHFMGAFCEFLGTKIGKPLKLQANRPALYLSDDEKNTKVIDTPRPYFVINAGIKNDYTNKGHSRGAYQQVVDHFRGRIDFVQIGEKNPSHFHRPLENCHDMIGNTTARQLFQLVYHSSGGIGPTTFLQHIFAALERPYVCVLGGREPKWWCEYPRQTTLSTMGTLPCCAEKACWKSRVVPLNDGNSKDKSLCDLPTMTQWGDTIPKCMAMITPQAMIDALERYVLGGMVKLA